MRIHFNPPAADPIEHTTARRRASPKPPSLPPRAEAALFTKALAAALEDLKRQLPPGYLQSKAQARVGVALPPIAGAMASIIRCAATGGWFSCAQHACGDMVHSHSPRSRSWQLQGM